MLSQNDEQIQGRPALMNFKIETRVGERIAYTLLAVGFCLVLAVRPIPSEFGDNDTGRYVAFFQQYCKGLFTYQEFNKELSFELFNIVSFPACLTGSDTAFLFLTASYLPLAFLLFARWSEGALLWSVALLASFYGLELTFNALRQGLAVMMFFGAIALVRRNAVFSMLAGVLAAAAHASVLAFLPLLLHACFRGMSARMKVWGRGFLILAVVITLLAYRSTMLGVAENFGEMFELYKEFYVEELNPLFLYYVCTPLYFVYALRRMYEPEAMSEFESYAIAYSTAAIILCLVFFPFITFRIAILAVALQVFLIVDSGRHSISVGALALAGLVSHWGYFFLTSNYYDVLFSG